MFHLIKRETFRNSAEVTYLHKKTEASSLRFQQAAHANAMCPVSRSSPREKVIPSRILVTNIRATQKQNVTDPSSGRGITLDRGTRFRQCFRSERRSDAVWENIRFLPGLPRRSVPFRAFYFQPRERSAFTGQRTVAGHEGRRVRCGRNGCFVCHRAKRRNEKRLTRTVRRVPRDWRYFPSRTTTCPHFGFSHPLFSSWGRRDAVPPDTYCPISSRFVISRKD